MYIFNEKESLFLDENQNIIDTFELGHKYTMKELNKVNHKPDYKYYICLKEDEKITDLEQFSKNINLPINKISNKFDKKIRSTNNYITFCVSFTSNMKKTDTTKIQGNTYQQYRFNNCSFRVVLSKEAIIFKLYSGYNTFESLFKGFLDVDVVSGGFLRYWTILAKEMFKQYSNFLFIIIQNLNKLSLQFNTLDYYKLQDVRKLTIEYNVLLQTLYNELQSFLFTNSNLKNQVLSFPFQRGLDRYIQKNNKNDPCGCSDKIFNIDDYSILREAKDILGLYGNLKDGKAFYGCQALEEVSKKNRSYWCYVNNPEKCESSKSSNYINTEEWISCSKPDLDYNNYVFKSTLDELEVSVLNQITELEQWREYTKNLIEGIMNAISFHDSNSNKILSIVTSFFLPISFLAGWYGINFKNMPEFSHPTGYKRFIYINIFIVLVIMFNYRDDILFYIKDNIKLIQEKQKKLIPFKKREKEEFMNYKETLV